MPEIVGSMETWPSGPGQGRYPWHEWLDGQTRRFVRGEDFEGDSERFRNAAHQACRRRGVWAHTRVTGEDGQVVVYVQAYDKVPPASSQ